LYESWSAEHDTIKIYSTKMIESQLHLTRGGMILIGLLAGGDYDPVRAFTRNRSSQMPDLNL
jgi:hypothetical protein